MKFICLNILRDSKKNNQINDHNYQILYKPGPDA